MLVVFEIPFIQFFSGWKWKAVLCHDSILLFQGNDSPACKPNTLLVFSDTPADLPRETAGFQLVEGTVCEVVVEGTACEMVDSVTDADNGEAQRRTLLDLW